MGSIALTDPLHGTPLITIHNGLPLVAEYCPYYLSDNIRLIHGSSLGIVQIICLDCSLVAIVFVITLAYSESALRTERAFTLKRNIQFTGITERTSLVN